MDAVGYGSRPSYGELGVVLLAGAGHVLVELGSSVTIATVYNVAVSILVAGYVVWRVRRTPGVLKTWGMRMDNFGNAMRAQLWWVVVALVFLVGYAVLLGSLSLPVTFWFTLVLYPVWGIAQQFALQNLIAKNLTGVLVRPLSLAIGAATLFGLAHVPRVELVVLTFLSGIFFTLIYRRYPNLWAVGTVHGLLGSLVFYLVLREDPGAVIIGFLLGG